MLKSLPRLPCFHLVIPGVLLFRMQSVSSWNLCFLWGLSFVFSKTPCSWFRVLFVVAWHCFQSLSIPNWIGLWAVSSKVPLFLVVSSGICLIVLSCHICTSAVTSFSDWCLPAPGSFDVTVCVWLSAPSKGIWLPMNQQAFGYSHMLAVLVFWVLVT